MRCTLEPLACEDLGAPRHVGPNDGRSGLFGINEAGIAVGWSTHPDHLFVGVTQTGQGALQPLGVGAGWDYSLGHAINAAGAAVGRAIIFDSPDPQHPQHAVYWEPDGTPHLLQEFVDGAEGWQLPWGRRIDDAGRILAFAP